MVEHRPSILIVDDEEKLRRYLRKEFERKGYMAHEAPDRAGALAALAAPSVDVVLLDIVMPGAGGMSILEELRRERPELQVIMLTGNASVETAVQAMKLGAYDYLAKPYDLQELQLLVDRAYAEARLRRQNRALRLELARHEELGELSGAGAALTAAREALTRLAAGSAPVLLEGEPGTGKELAARLLHRESPFGDGPFLVLDCAASDEAALERELFGRADEPGLLALADEGSVFLDDVEALPPPLQARLLRFIASGEYQRAGDPRTLRSRARLIAATRADLAEEVRARRFGWQLRERLMVAGVRMPPLRERPEDIPPLAEHFLARHRARQGRGPNALTPEALSKLARYGWPGNARQLENVIARAALRAEGETVGTDDLFLPRSGDGALEDAASLASVERSHILKVLSEAGGNRTRAAAVLGIDVKTLYNKLKEYRVQP